MDASIGDFSSRQIEVLKARVLIWQDEEYDLVVIRISGMEFTFNRGERYSELFHSPFRMSLEKTPKGEHVFRIKNEDEPSAWIYVKFYEFCNQVQIIHGELLDSLNMAEKHFGAKIWDTKGTEPSIHFHQETLSSGKRPSKLLFMLWVYLAVCTLLLITYLHLSITEGQFFILLCVPLVFFGSGLAVGFWHTFMYLRMQIKIWRY